MDIKEQIKELRRLIKKSLGQSGPLSNPTKCIVVERITSEGMFVTKKDVTNEEWETDHDYFLKLATAIWENSEDLDEPPIEPRGKAGIEYLRAWCIKSDRKEQDESIEAPSLTGKLTPTQKKLHRQADMAVILILQRHLRLKDATTYNR